ncbi:hypothetical protein DFJ74DRAFT_762762 [Hyaloraphidium curvatum]|nr:hypothetical protein DFJ74DRAFT_762762 [Hyaloraphidium curvatum]
MRSKALAGMAVPRRNNYWYWPDQARGRRRKALHVQVLLPRTSLVAMGLSRHRCMHRCEVWGPFHGPQPTQVPAASPPPIARPIDTASRRAGEMTGPRRVPFALLAIALFAALAVAVRPVAAGGAPAPAAPTCCAGCSYTGNRLNCCCPRSRRTKTVLVTFTRTRTSAPRLLERGVPSADNEVQEPEDAGAGAGGPDHRLFARHMCPACRRGIVPSWSNPCCPLARTVTRTITRTRTVLKAARKTTALPATRSFSGFVYLDTAGSGAYDPARGLANVTLVAAVAGRKRVAGGVVIGQATSGAFGAFQFTVTTSSLIPGSPIIISLLCAPDSVLLRIAIDAARRPSPTNNFVAVPPDLFAQLCAQTTSLAVSTSLLASTSLAGSSSTFASRPETLTSPSETLAPPTSIATASSSTLSSTSATGTSSTLSSTSETLTSWTATTTSLTETTSPLSSTSQTPTSSTLSSTSFTASTSTLSTTSFTPSSSTRSSTSLTATTSTLSSTSETLTSSSTTETATTSSVTETLTSSSTSFTATSSTLSSTSFTPSTSTLSSTSETPSKTSEIPSTTSETESPTATATQTTCQTAGAVIFTSIGTTTFTPPPCATALAAVCVSGGGGGNITGFVVKLNPTRNEYYGMGGGGGALAWRNNISPAQPLEVVVGAGGTSDITLAGGPDQGTVNGGQSRIAVVGGAVLIRVTGGTAGFPGVVQVPGLPFVPGITGGGNGGIAGFGFPPVGIYFGGGGGAGGYVGNGGEGGTSGGTTDGQGGGGGGGGAEAGGGGVGLLGNGTSGNGGTDLTEEGEGGSGGEDGNPRRVLANGTRWIFVGEGGRYGGGAGGAPPGRTGVVGGQGACRIAWGPGVSYPNNARNVG